ICNECGKSVKFGTGNYVNRIIDLNDYTERVEMFKPFPQGNFICSDCDYELTKKYEESFNVRD
ncbi:MAG: hypothetical protein RBR74_02880, partial [Ignavibacteriaceae bacterium]|nr:hypothetical protein [Ignavibacteriaceae bacterium]